MEPLGVDRTMDSLRPANVPRSPLFDAGGPLSPDALAEVRGHPRFLEAMQANATGLVSLYRGNRFLNVLLNDRGRVLIGMFALYLHYWSVDGESPPGLTVTRMQALCAETGVASGGRVRVLLSLMRAASFLETVADDDRRRQLLQPGARLMSMQRERWDLQTRTTAMVFPDVARAHQVLDRDDFVAALVRQFIDPFRAGFRVLEPIPELILFSDRNAGLVIMFDLLASGTAGDRFPPTQPFPISISAIARKFNVSRAHIQKLLRDAAEERFIERIGDDQLRLLPRLSDATQIFFATIFAYFALGVRTALKEIEGKAERQ